ncbi:MAG: glycosyltransferase 87 family protein [Pseudomonadota bacterium]
MLAKWLDRLLALGALSIVILYYRIIEDAYMPTRWAADLQYWWVVGELWWIGETPYGDAYWELGFQEFSLTFQYPFFYPPTSIPFLGLFALVEPAMASRLLVIYNICMILFASLFLAVFEDRPAYLNIQQRFALLVIIIGIVFFPSMVTTVFGGFQFTLLAGLMLWAIGARAGLIVVQALGLVLLMMKPQLGAALGFYCLVVPEFRKGAIIAGAALVGLFFLGSNGVDPITLVRDWLSNVAAYTAYAANSAERGAGLGWLLGLVGVELGILGTALPIMVTAAALAMLSTLREPLTVATILMIVACFFWAGHQSDFVLFAPIFAMLLRHGPLPGRFLLFLSLLPLSRGYEVAIVAGGVSQGGTEDEAMMVLAGVQTLGLLAALAAALWLSRDEVVRAPEALWCRWRRALLRQPV